MYAFSIFLMLEKKPFAPVLSGTIPNGAMFKRDVQEGMVTWPEYLTPHTYGSNSRWRWIANRWKATFRQHCNLFIMKEYPISDIQSTLHL